MDLDATAFEILSSRPEPGNGPRPTIRSHGHAVVAVFLVAVAARDENAVYYQEVDVVLTHDAVLTVRKTPSDGRPPYDPRSVLAACPPDDPPGMVAYRIVDDIAERFLDLIDDLDAEIDELEDDVEARPPAETRRRVSELRHDLLHIRRTLAPTRDAVHRVVSNAIDVEEGPPIFTRQTEIAFGAAYDKLLRAFDGLELARDLLAGVRDYLQGKVAQDQNDVMKRLTVVASLLLAPTFIVGLYGQNFVDIPELRWRWGYAWSWGVIVATTLLQLWWFRRKRWI